MKRTRTLDEGKGVKRRRVRKRVRFKKDQSERRNPKRGNPKRRNPKRGERNGGISTEQRLARGRRPL